VLKKVLIANRGEIAVRIMRTCQEIGVSTVAVYSEPDRDAMHVRFADEAHALGGRTAAESYLNTEAILGVLERTGADGLHPGYGFLAENAGFARAVTGRDVVFLGPPPAAIEAMGDKISARRAAQAAGVPVLPGSPGALSSVADLVGFGETYGWPVVVKAAFGGGGRGMKVIAAPAGAAAAMESARREATGYFGRPELYAERFLTRPRHIEMQILADVHGHVVWLGERDCSVQRRHQKLVEESPAPGFPDDVRRAMGEASVRLARACGYTGVGTVEFLYAGDRFFFLEMNTRLQVEHPVTELVTGLDLVEWQLRVASGEELAFGQDDITVTGHAIEVRINAEDPARGRFRPSPGTLTRFVPPLGPGVRVDSGYAVGDTLGPFYDNLVAKLVVWAPDRDRARGRMLRALRETEIGGVATTIPAQAAILDHPDFIAARHAVNWVDTELDPSILDRVTSPAPSAGIPAEPSVLGAKRPPWRSRRGVPAITTWSPPRPAQGTGAGSAGAPPARHAASPRHSPGQILAPMQGTIIQVLAGVGDRVLENEGICVMEAMKMENVVRAGVSGSVTEIRVSPGETVDSGALIAVVRE
jgi:acetyl-CoA/propionyl-CoA/long-chain acyl-CoA carboxylase, biotin carboxylase, biotin carboxyl carrier protein